MHIVQDLRERSLWNAWERRDSELLSIYFYLTGDHCWINPFSQQALNIWLPIYSTVVWVSFGEIQAQVLAKRQQSVLTHQPHLRKGDIKTVTVFFFFKLFYKVMFYVFFYDMSSLGNVPHPCSFLLSVFIWEQTAVIHKRPLCRQQASLETLWCHEQVHLSHQKFDAKCITWSSL